LPEIADIIRRSEELVARYWPNIERVAMALLEHGRLDRAEVLRLIGSLKTGGSFRHLSAPRAI
jgi:hypothetical protein